MLSHSTLSDQLLLRRLLIISIVYRYCNTDDDVITASSTSHSQLPTKSVVFHVISECQSELVIRNQTAFWYYLNQCDVDKLRRSSRLSLQMSYDLEPLVNHHGLCK